jgi:hypothetical protein
MFLVFMRRVFVLMGSVLAGVPMVMHMGIAGMAVLMDMLMDMLMRVRVLMLVYMNNFLVTMLMAMYMRMLMGVQMLMFMLPFHGLTLLKKSALFFAIIGSSSSQFPIPYRLHL